MAAGRRVAAPDESLVLLPVGAGVLIPTMPARPGSAHWVFRGKVRPEDGHP